MNADKSVLGSVIAMLAVSFARANQSNGDFGAEVVWYSTVSIKATDAKPEKPSSEQSWCEPKAVP